MNPYQENYTIQDNQKDSGFFVKPGYLNLEQQKQCIHQIRLVLEKAPLFQPRMPVTGHSFSVKMSNAGPLGWISDQKGYRYQTTHPVTGNKWSPIPDIFKKIWYECVPKAPEPETCLINWYGQEKARMGLHRDWNEEDLTQPIISISLGASAWFRVGGMVRSDKTRRLKLSSGDVLILSGKSRAWYHGIDRVIPHSSQLLPSPQRLNVTLRRVHFP